MSPGRLAPLSLAAALAVGASGGCQAPTWSSRAPGMAEVKTRVEGDRARSPQVVATKDVEPAPNAATPPEPIEGPSPLPPALERPATPVPPEPSSTPLLDEALARAEARNRDLVEVLAKDDAPKPSATVALAAATTPPAAMVPPPAVPRVDPKPPEPAPKPPEPDPKTPEEIWREGLRALRTVARDKLREPAAPAPGGPSWPVRDRLLAWLAEPEIDPEAPNHDDLARGRAVLKGLANLIDPASPSPGRGAEIREAVAALESRAPLEIAELIPCRMVHGFGDVEPLDPPARKAGQSVVLYSEIDGLSYEPSGGSYRSRVEGQVDLIPEGSNTPAWSHALPMVEDACRKRRRDYFIGHKFTLPETLAPGKYRLRLMQKDLVAGQVATRETGIDVVK